MQVELEKMGQEKQLLKTLQAEVAELQPLVGKLKMRETEISQLKDEIIKYKQELKVLLSFDLNFINCNRAGTIQSLSVQY